MTHVDLFTANYSAFRDSMGTPVQISNGKPRYPVKYDLRYAVKEAYPAWALVKGHKPHAEFKAAYHAALDQIGVETLMSRFRAIVVAEDEPRLVLLCFEDLSKGADNWCHRTMFAEWWHRNTGDQVRELGPRLEDAPAPDPTLF